MIFYLKNFKYVFHKYVRDYFKILYSKSKIFQKQSFERIAIRILQYFYFYDSLLFTFLMALGEIVGGSTVYFIIKKTSKKKKKSNYYIFEKIG